MKRSLHSLSNFKLFTCDMGELVPCGIVDVLPGDTLQMATNALVRASPLLSPVMHPVDVRIHHWFVPNRLVWDNWEAFITGGPDGLNASVFPTITIAAGAAVGSLADYLGVPTGVPNIQVSALPFRGYAAIFNQWYRDQDLQTPLVFSKADGADSTTNTTLQLCQWEKDYFTSARPWEVKGPTVTVPLGTSAPVKGIGVTSSGVGTVASGQVFRQTAPLADMMTGADPLRMALPSAANFGIQVDTTASSTQKPVVVADLTNASAVTVNALRTALAFQRFEEMRSRYGSRYVEYLRSAFGVKSSDGRLDLPEYLGGGRQTIQWSEVLTTGANGTDPVATMKGHGIAAMRSNRFVRFFEEHGYVFTFMSVRPKTIYGSGLPRHFNRRTKEEFYQPEFEFIGQQAIKNKEIYAAHAAPDGTFGFQDRYDEYRRTESTIAGEYRTTLNFWHFARIFGSTPALNGSFVQCAPTEVPFAVSTTDVLWVMAKHSIQARRRISATGGKSFIR